MNAVFKKAAIAILAVATYCGGNHCLAAPTEYTVDLLTPENYAFMRDSWLLDINDQGQAVGYIQYEDSGDYMYQPFTRRDR